MSAGGHSAKSATGRRTPGGDSAKSATGRWSIGGSMSAGGGHSAKSATAVGSLEVTLQKAPQAAGQLAPP